MTGVQTCALPISSGIPVVSTKVGMVPDIAKDEKNVLLADVDGSEELLKQAKRVIEDGDSKERLVQNATDEVKKYSWDNIARRYYQEVYSRL